MTTTNKIYKISKEDSHQLIKIRNLKKENRRFKAILHQSLNCLNNIVLEIEKVKNEIHRIEKDYKSYD